MRIGPHDEIWVVTDPTPISTMADIFIETSIADLEFQFRGGLTVEENPTLFTKRDEAEAEARQRLSALRRD